MFSTNNQAAFQDTIEDFERHIADAATDNDRNVWIDAREAFVEVFERDVELAFENAESGEESDALNQRVRLYQDIAIDAVLSAGNEHRPHAQALLEDMLQDPSALQARRQRLEDAAAQARADERSRLEDLERRREAIRAQAPLEREKQARFIAQAQAEDQADLYGRRAEEEAQAAAAAQQQAGRDAQATVYVEGAGPSGPSPGPSGPSPTQQAAMAEAEMIEAIRMQQDQVARDSQAADERLAAALADLDRQAGLLRAEAERQMRAVE